VIHKLGELPIMTTGRRGDTIGKKLYDLLEHEKSEYTYRFNKDYYEAVLKIRIPMRTFKRRGHCLNATNITNFNLHIENEIKGKYYFIMDELMEHLPNIEANLPQVRRKLGIDIEAWSDDSMKKDYYRYRVDTGKLLLRIKKNSAAPVR
jgi:hypothetical protein